MCVKLLLGAGLLCSLCARASDWSSLYGEAALVREKPRLQQLVTDIAANEINPYFTSGQRLLFASLPVDMPLMTDGASPIDADVHRSGTLVLPALTLLFVEDLAKAYAWLWTNRFSSETVDEYLSMLRYRKATEFRDGKYPAPVAALHVPVNALENADTKKMFLRLRMTAYLFLVLHQMDHQRGSGDPDGEHADLFALDLTKRNSETPLGVLLLMNAGVYLPDPVHPVTAKRLLVVANYLDGRTEEFVEARPDRLVARNAIHAIAKSFRASAESLMDPGTQVAWAERARRTDVSTLVPKIQQK